MSQLVVETRDLMRPIAHFSHAVRIDDVIYVGATAGTDAARELAGAKAGCVDTVAQAERMFDNLALSLHRLGGTLDDLVQIKSYLVDMRDVQAYRSVAAARVGAIPHAHAIAGAWFFPLPQAMVELDAIAVIGAGMRGARTIGEAPLAARAPWNGVMCDDQHFAAVLPFSVGGSIAAGQPDEQARQLWENVEASLASAGLTTNEIVRLQITLGDIRHLPTLDHVLDRRLRQPYPARTVVAAQLADARALFQVEIFAVRGGGTPVGASPDGTRAVSPAMVVRDTLYTSGFVAPPGHTGTVEQECNLVWDHLLTTLQSEGFPPDSILRTNNVLTHWHDFSDFNAAYGPRVTWPYPPRTTVLGSLADAASRVQIEAIAHRRAAEATVLQVPREA